MEIFDTHAHFPEDGEKISRLLERASAAGVTRLMAVGGSPELNRAALIAASAADGAACAPKVLVALGMDRDQLPHLRWIACYKSFPRLADIWSVCLKMKTP
jgi:Tat protein secretion system quality control protein TatD with DNase activity